MLKEFIIWIASFWSVIHQMIHKIHPWKPLINYLNNESQNLKSIPALAVVPHHSDIDGERLGAVQIRNKSTQPRINTQLTNSTLQGLIYVCTSHCLHFQALVDRSDFHRHPKACLHQKSEQLWLLMHLNWWYKYYEAYLFTEERLKHFSEKQQHLVTTVHQEGPVQRDVFRWELKPARQGNELAILVLLGLGELQVVHLVHVGVEHLNELTQGQTLHHYQGSGPLI